MKIKLLITWSMVMTASLLYAQQEEPAKINWWVEPGMGSYTTFSKKGSNKLTYALGVAALRENTVYKLRYRYNHEFEFFNEVYPTEYFHSFNFLLGKRILNRPLTEIHILTGIGLTSGLKRGEYLGDTYMWFFVTLPEYTSDRFVTPSIPFELDFIFKATKYVGLGSGVFFELNFKKPMIGFTGKIILGKIK